MRILHTEASTGLGGQELRILKEAEGMRDRGHEVILAVVRNGQLISRARDVGFTVYELPLETRWYGLGAAWALTKLVRKHQIELINTHSSWDAWVGGITGRLTGCPVVRTRHLSTPTRRGLNSRLLYRTLADAVVTTCEETAQAIQLEVGLTTAQCRSIPTGVVQSDLHVTEAQRNAFRAQHGICDSDIVVGTACVLRGWKGIADLVTTAKLLENQPHLKWLIVGDGPSRAVMEEQAKQLAIHHHFIFTGYLRHPQAAIAAMDLFVLLSTANEGVSQAVLQAAYLRRPLITTPTGGLREVCVDGKTGFLVPTHSPHTVAERIVCLAEDSELRQSMGRQGHQHVVDRFTMDHTLNSMESVYATIAR